MGLRWGFVSFGKKGDVPEGLWKSVFFLTGFLAGRCKQAIPPCSAFLFPSRSAAGLPPCGTQQDPGRWLVTTAGGCPVLALGWCPAKPGQPRQGTPPHPHRSASPCRGSSLAGARLPPALLGQETCGAKVTWFKSPEPVADCCSALFGKRIRNLGQPRCPTPTGSVCPGQRVPPRPLPPAAQAPAKKSNQLHF